MNISGAVEVEMLERLRQEAQCDYKNAEKETIFSRLFRSFCLKRAEYNSTRKGFSSILSVS